MKGNEELALRVRAILLVFEKIYSCLFIPNCTRNHLITSTNNKAKLIAKSPETLHFPEDYLQQQKNLKLSGTGLVAEKFVN